MSPKATIPMCSLTLFGILIHLVARRPKRLVENYSLSISLDGIRRSHSRLTGEVFHLNQRLEKPYQSSRLRCQSLSYQHLRMETRMTTITMEVPRRISSEMLLSICFRQLPHLILYLHFEKPTCISRSLMQLLSTIIRIRLARSCTIYRLRSLLVFHRLPSYQSIGLWTLLVMIDYVKHLEENSNLTLKARSA